jgi:hypothetical protein
MKKKKRKNDLKNGLDFKQKQNNQSNSAESVQFMLVEVELTLGQRLK